MCQTFRISAASSSGSAKILPANTSEGDMRSAFFAAYREEQCEHIKLSSPEIDKRLKEGPALVSANFVIPYPPGFPIMVPGQVIDCANHRIHAQARRQGDSRIQCRTGVEVVESGVSAIGESVREGFSGCNKAGEIEGRTRCVGR